MFLTPKVPGLNHKRRQNVFKDNLEMLLAIARKLKLENFRDTVYHFVPAALRATAHKSPRLLSQCTVRKMDSLSRFLALNC